MTKYDLQHLPVCQANNSSEANIFYVYGLFDPESLELRYIGQTYNLINRYHDHLTKKNLKNKTYKSNWIKSLCKINLYPVMIVMESHDSLDNVMCAEEELIAYYKYIGCNLTNLTIGGEGRMGNTQKFEVRQQISKKLKKDKLIENKEEVLYVKDREIIVTKVVSQHARDVASKTHKGKIMSEESKQKISIGLKGENHPFFGKKMSRDHILNMVTSRNSTVESKNYKLSFQIAEEIRELYNTGNFTLNQLGKKYGVAYTTISKIINGHRYSRELYLK